MGWAIGIGTVCWMREWWLDSPISLGKSMALRWTFLSRWVFYHRPEGAWLSVENRGSRRRICRKYRLNTAKCLFDRCPSCASTRALLQKSALGKWLPSSWSFCIRLTTCYLRNYALTGNSRALFCDRWFAADTTLGIFNNNLSEHTANKFVINNRDRKNGWYS